MRYIVTLLLLFAGLKMQAQINWKDARNWKLYAVDDREGLSIDVEKLKNRVSVALDSAQLRPYLQDVTPMQKEKAGVWMGLYVVTCELKVGQPRKILISTYGAFFYDSKTDTYYQLPEDKNQDWQRFLNETSQKLSKN